MIDCDKSAKRPGKHYYPLVFGVKYSRGGMCVRGARHCVKGKLKDISCGATAISKNSLLSIG